MGQTSLTLIPPNEPTPFVYGMLDRGVEVAARSDAALIKGLMRRTEEDLIEIGRALIRQKANLPHGLFLPWLKTEFDMSEATARRMMSVGHVFGGKSVSLTDLGAGALYELASPSTPEEVRAEVERRIATGEIVDAAVVRTLKTQYAEMSATATDLAKIADQVKEQNRDLMANAHQRAREEYASRIDSLEKRLALAEEMAAASMRSSEMPTAENVVVQFVPRDEVTEIIEPDSDDIDDVDLADLKVGAHVIYGSLSSIDLAETTPEVFWALFGTSNGKIGTVKWLDNTIKKLKAIKKGMPK